MHSTHRAQLFNMIRIQNDKGEVLVLDKVKRNGWEGLTFPGGKIEPMESLADSVRREAWEETGLRLGRIQYCGSVSWVFEDDPDFRMLGLLFRCDEFEGEIHASDEGPLFWMDEEVFLRTEPKSDSMNELLAIYAGKATEVVIRYRGEEKIGSVFFGEE